MSTSPLTKLSISPMLNTNFKNVEVETVKEKAVEVKADEITGLEVNIEATEIDKEAQET